MNNYALFALLGAVWYVGVVAYVSVRQLKEALRPRNAATTYRWMLFALLAISLFTMLPSVVYQFMRYTNQDNIALRNFVTITSTIARYANGALLLFVYLYKIKIDE